IASTGLPLRKGSNRTPPGHRAPAIEREAAMDGKVQRMKPGNRIWLPNCSREGDNLCIRRRQGRGPEKHCGR
ncbi:hypothetical protein, partial [Enterococcus faecium]